MKLTPISLIEIPKDRQRRLFDPVQLQEFGDGIAKRGLLHPIILREVAGQLILVAGERRLRAVLDLVALDIPIRHDGELLPLGHIPYTLFDDLDPIAAAEAEFEENIHRANLTWQERAAAVARLDSLRGAQAAARGEPAPTTADIALEVRGSAEGSYHEATRRELIVARHLGNPAVAAAKTVDEAFKVIKREESSERDRALGERVGRSFSANDHRASQADSRVWLLECAGESYDCILTDPPYGVGADEFGDSGGLAAGAHGYKDDEETFRSLMDIFIPESFRIAKPAAHLYCFCDLDYYGELRDRFADAGWWVHRTPLIWHKPNGMRVPWANPPCGPQRRYEIILFAVKGKRNVIRIAGDVLEYPSDANLGHAAQKPEALYRDLLSRSCRPGDSVVDPFCGSGTIFPSAHGLRVKATGVELSQASYGIAVARLEGLKAQGELAP